ncbi:MAG TPA: sarcosine oxidase subunit gamma family protein [Steroidobacteraceae bacterium]|nr:sarcosine oxidase subunit gamma family protein [Steroidobacteraceae bacterium]
MSAPERELPGEAAAGTRCAPVGTDIIELTPFRERTHVLKALAARRGLALPATGWLAITRETLLLCVRPERWLLLTAPAPPGAALAAWRPACAGCAAAIELTAGLTALHLAGPAVREVLARGCRLDLHPEVFVPGSAAATTMAQVSVTLGALPGGWLLLTPSSTAQHLREWLAATARPFGFAPDAMLSVSSLSGERAP